MKKCLVIVVACMIVFSLAACGDSETSSGDKDSVKATVTDTAECAAFIKENVEFVDFMSEVDQDIMLEIYNIDPTLVKECSGYFSTGATAEEIAVIAVTDGDEDNKITTVKEALDGRIEAQKTSFENYVPEELTKLEKPMIMKTNNAVVMVVCNDAALAKEAMLSFIGK